ncbi:hypothetical protein JZ785_10780 [Alicyclobacillus curvatus]|nr:hypothetical protein JZ785_10780 [Alicyclobacillus curvatus]
MWLQHRDCPEAGQSLSIVEEANVFGLTRLLFVLLLLSVDSTAPRHDDQLLLTGMTTPSQSAKVHAIQ